MKHLLLIILVFAAHVSVLCQTEFDQKWGSPREDYPDIVFRKDLSDGKQLYEVLGEPNQGYTGFFVFQDGGLIKIVTVFHEPHLPATFYYKNLLTEYGQPSQEVDGDLHKYYWESGGTVIGLAYNENNLVLTYEEWKKP